MTSPDLGLAAAKAALDRAGVDPAQVEEAIFGSARAGRQRPDPGPARYRYAAASPKRCTGIYRKPGLRLGYEGRPGFQGISSGDLDCALAGGTESMSRVPYYLEGRWGYRLGQPGADRRHVSRWLLLSAVQVVIGETAEVLAEQYQIQSRGTGPARSLILHH